MSWRMADRMAAMASSWMVSFLSSLVSSCASDAPIPSRSEHLAQLDKGAHDVDAHFDGARAA